MEKENGKEQVIYLTIRNLIENCVLKADVQLIWICKEIKCDISLLIQQY